MGWFSKEDKKPEKKEIKDNKVPELPELPELPPSDSKVSSFKESSLPSFPLSPAGDKMSQYAVKQAVGESPKTQELPEFQPDKVQVPKFKEIEEKPSEPRQIPKTEPRVPTFSPRKPLPASNKEPIFIRIDKYQSTLAKFQEIKKQVLEIENMLRDIKEFKKREEAELFQWEQEIQSAKTKLEQIDRTLFQKLD